MSLSHDIDNDEQVFQFDSYQESHASAMRASLMFTRNPAGGASGGSSGTRAYTGGTPSQTQGRLDAHRAYIAFQDASGKGKAASHPLDFSYTPGSLIEGTEESIDMDVDTDSCDFYEHHPFPLSSPSMFNPDVFVQYSTEQAPLSYQADPYDGAESWSPPPSGSLSSKGKAREHAPVLPPLSFSPTSFDSENSFWASSSLVSPGPSSYSSSLYSPPPSDAADPSFTRHLDHTDQSPAYQTSPVRSPHSTSVQPIRSQSLSNISAQASSSSPPQSGSRIRSRLLSTRSQSKLTRKLFSKKSSPTTASSRPQYARSLTFGSIDAHSHLLNQSLTTKLKVDELDSSLPHHPHVQFQDVTGTHSSAFRTTRPVGSMHKWRSNSSPYPISALDVVPVIATSPFEPIPVIVKNYFDEHLPKELRLHILSCLLQIHEDDHFKVIESGRWTAARASSSRGKWTGRAKGYKELVKFGRVSKAWYELVLDGQLWAGIDLQHFQLVPDVFVLRLAKHIAAFTEGLDMAYYMRIQSEAITVLADSLCSPVGADGFGYTRLTSLNLQGCFQFTTRSLHYLLVRSPLLERLSVKGMTAVTNTTCDILSAYCPRIVSLNMNRCPNMDAEGIRRMASAAISRRESLPLKHLRLSGLRRVGESMMLSLAKAAPYLEVLDLSYSRDLHNAAFEAFVACQLEGQETLYESETTVVLAKDLGRESHNTYKYRRRVTRLRHLSLSACDLLTDDACSNLAYSLPRLEFLELAGIGADLKHDGLIRLLNTTPHLRRLDLEDATEITDAVLAAITPSEPTSINGADLSVTDATLSVEPGNALESLVVSYATRLTDDAFLALIRRCENLKHIEVDNTRIGANVLKEFVKLCKKRKQANACAGVVDCRGISEPLVKELSPNTRPRLGWRSYNARKLYYLDGRDGNLQDLKLGQDECDETRVVVKSFYSWQTVDAVKAAREKRRSKSRRNGSDVSGGSGDDMDDVRGGTRWWSPGGRGLRSGRTSPSAHLADMTSNEGCVVM